MDPDQIKALSNEGLIEAITQHQSDLDAVLSTENPTREDAAKARELNETLTALEAEKAERDQDEADFAAIREGREKAREEAAAANATQASTQPGDEDPDDDDEDDEDEDDEEDGVTASAPVIRTSARKVMAGRRPANPPDEDTQDAPRVSIIAAADVPDFGTGQELKGLHDVGQAMVARMQAFSPPSGRRGAEMQRFGVAVLRKPIPEEFVSKGGADEDFRASEAAARESALPGGSLTAAGGWCAPSETLYDLCAIETVDGVLSIPEFQVNRGGVRTMGNIDFQGLYDARGLQTETQAIAGATKTCYELECPAPTDHRLDASYLCVKIPLLTQAAYPELVTNVTERLWVAYQHSVSADLISRISTMIGAAEVVASQGSTAANTLTALELVADQKRQDYRLSQTQSMEVLLPFWVKAAIRADLALRNGVDMLSVTDAQIQAHFAARNLAVQWLYNWQQNTETGAFPGTFDAMMYPSGTFTKGTANVIRVDAVYDAASLEENVYTGFFFEEGMLVLERCQPSAKVTITVCSGGRTGAADNVECLTPPVTP